MEHPSFHNIHIRYIARVILLGNFDEAIEAVPGGSRSGDRDSGSCEQQLG